VSQPDDRSCPLAEPFSSEGVVTFGCPAGEVTVELAAWRGSGEVRVLQLDELPSTMPNGATAIGAAFDIDATGELTFDRATVTLPYSTSRLAAAQPSGGPVLADPRVLHLPDDGPASDITAGHDSADATVSGQSEGFSVFVAAQLDLERIAGADRVATAAAISRAAFQERGGTVYVASQETFPDALAGGPAAVRNAAPLLLAGRSDVPPATVAELQRLAPERIVLLGGTARVDRSAEAALTAFAPVERLAGLDRFATAAAISRSAFPDGARTVYVATGADYPDALAGGAAAAAAEGPVLLVGDGVPEVTAAELERLSPERIVVLGGAAAVSDAVVAALGPLAQEPVRRVAGPERLATASAVSASFAEPGGTVFVATGFAFPDALAGVAAAGRQGSPVLLIGGDAPPDLVDAELRRLDPDRIVVLGGEAALPAASASLLEKYLVP